MTDRAIEHRLEDAEEAWKRVAHVNVSAERMEEIRSMVVQDLRKKVKRPGFRQGKVPLDLIRREYAGDVEREALERVVPLAYEDVLKEHAELQPVGEPKVSNLSLEENEPVGFDLEIEIRPEIELVGLEDLRVERIHLLIDDERVDSAMQELADRNAQWIPVERVAQIGDALTIEYVPLDSEGQAIESERNPAYAMELGGEGVLPEFNDALQGLESGEDTQVEVEYPDDYPREDLRGKTMTFHVVLKDVKEKKIPEIDDDFAQSVSPHKTIEALREAVREDLEKAARREGERHFRDALVEGILKVNAISVPPTLEARYVQAMIEDLQHRSGREFDEETLQKLAESYRPSARLATQRWLLIDHVKKSQQIEVADEDIQARIEEIAAEQGRSPDEIRQALQMENHLDHLKMEIEEDRAYEWLAEQVQVEVVERTVDEAGEADESPEEGTDPEVAQ